MPLSPPDLSIALELVNCEGINLSDTTGEYDEETNPLGYGLPGGAAINDIDAVTITLRYSKLESDLVFDFVLVNGVITAATATFAGGTPVNILTLISTNFPFVDFELLADYGLTLPDFEDDVYKVTYVITGVVDVTAFNYETIAYLPVSCNSRCCIDKKWLALDPACDCKTDKLQQAFVAESYLKQFEKACDQGDIDAALLALAEVEKLCEDCEC